MAKKKLTDTLREIVEEEALHVYVNYDAECSYKKYNSDIKTIFVYESPTSNNKLQFYMLNELQSRLKKINERFVVGIIYTAKPDEEDEDR
tara:strand:+ start:643 stop:912 length:270 start_codon:yes stop_codon:yes gene_type:complete